MNADQLAKEAAKSTAPFVRAVSDDVMQKLELAYVAQWLFNQDESIRGKAADTACAAIDQINSWHLNHA